MSEQLTNANFTAMTGITFPIDLEYADRWYPAIVPGGARMKLHESGDLEFCNEKGRKSGRHAKFTFFREPAHLRQFQGFLALRISDFHCTGAWGVWQGWGRTLEFTCLLEDCFLVCRNVASDEVNKGRIIMRALVHRGPKRPRQEDFSLDAGAAGPVHHR